MPPMTKLRCADYGFECEFVAEGEVDSVVDTFGTHMEEEHGIGYNREALMQVILRQKNEA
ncbi:hypothetical protein CENSYa_1658 [Cenarchaeum symbiosum A]|uniref:Small metal-binding protein n=1 Tax=Cenarchaeum symbiosum (strain A) TaxID=414004 RepID=A0RY59_CENSY|nr:hypothetical protein CENSYa_1658 [Cenarchaeum symbiosum A]